MGSRTKLSLYLYHQESCVRWAVLHPRPGGGRVRHQSPSTTALSTASSAPSTSTSSPRRWSPASTTISAQTVSGDRGRRQEHHSNLMLMTKEECSEWNPAIKTENLLNFCLWHDIYLRQSECEIKSWFYSSSVYVMLLSKRLAASSSLLVIFEYLIEVLPLKVLRKMLE